MIWSGKYNTILRVGPSKKALKTVQNVLKNRDALNRRILTTKVRPLGVQELSWVILGSILGSLEAPFGAQLGSFFSGLVPGRVPGWILGVFWVLWESFWESFW